MNSSKSHKEISIGKNTTIGANCYIDGSSIGDEVLVGNGASIYNSTIENGSVVAAGAVVAPGTVVPKNQIWAGSPARYLRDIKPEEKESIAENRDELVELSGVLVEETEKSQHELFIDAVVHHNKMHYSDTDKEWLEQNMKSYNPYIADEHGLEADLEGYYNLPLESREHELNDESLGYETKLEHDMRNYPDYFKIYRENYKKYDEINRNAENIARGDPADIWDTNPIKPQRPGAMRAWTSKWDSNFNKTFKMVGSRAESNNVSS